MYCAQNCDSGFYFLLFYIGAGIAKLVERPTGEEKNKKKNTGAILTIVRVPDVARDLSPRVNGGEVLLNVLRCQLTY